jgi:hypothetical protein
MRHNIVISVSIRGSRGSWTQAVLVLYEYSLPVALPVEDKKYCGCS